MDHWHRSHVLSERHHVTYYSMCYVMTTTFFLALDSPDGKIFAVLVCVLHVDVWKDLLPLLAGVLDLAVVEHISDHVLVMHHGKIVESASAEAIYNDPQNDYTKTLLAAVPTLA